MTYKRITLQERMEIFKGLYHLKIKPKQIAIQLGRQPSTISREIKRGTESGQYNPFFGELSHLERRRTQCPKLKITGKLWKEIEPKLQLRWSPEQVSKFLKETHQESVCAKTIYNYVHFHMKGELKKIALKDFRLKGKKRRLSKKLDQRGKLKNMTLIDERPREVESREVPGHWEGDLIIGKDHKSALAVIVERKTRYVQIDLLEKYDAYSVRRKIENRFKKMEPHLRKTLTLDQGRENSQHETLKKNMKVDVFFCHPASPWEKGTCENTNYLIRDMLDGEDDFRKKKQIYFTHIARKLNERPRQTLGFKTPKEVFNNLR